MNCPKITTPARICGHVIEITPYNLNRGRGKFCSRQCQGKMKSLKNTFKSSCAYCHTEIVVQKSDPLKKRGKYCSRACYSRDKSGTPVEKNCLVCGKNFVILESKLKRRAGKYCSKKCNAQGYSGEINHNWKGGITPEHVKIRTSPEYISWRTDTYKRDNYTCQLCGVRGGKLRANHIKKFSDYPELRLEPMNGITICETCDYSLVMHNEESWESYFNFNLEARGYLNV